MAGDVLKHASSPSLVEVVREFEAQQRVTEDGKRDEDGGHSHEHQKRGKQPAVERQRMDLAVADRRQRHERHVEGVEERPSLDEHEPERAEQDGRHEHGGDDKESPPEGPCRAIEAAAHACIVVPGDHGRKVTPVDRR